MAGRKAFQIMALDFGIPWSELRWTFSRAGGPGGQNVNKVSSKATLRWNIVDTQALAPDVKIRLLEQQRNRINGDGELVLESQRFRDQPRNRQDCLDRLRILVGKASQRPRIRRLTRPTRASAEKRLRAKLRQARRKTERKRPISE
jgi:ribosome-associated protein